MSAVLLARVNAAGGPDAVAEVLRLAGVTRTPEYLLDITNWIAYDEAVALWQAGAQVTHHPAEHCAWTCGLLSADAAMFGVKRSGRGTRYSPFSHAVKREK